MEVTVVVPDVIPDVIVGELPEPVELTVGFGVEEGFPDETGVLDELPMLDVDPVVVGMTGLEVVCECDELGTDEPDGVPELVGLPVELGVVVKPVLEPVGLVELDGLAEELELVVTAVLEPVGTEVLVGLVTE